MLSGTPRLQAVICSRGLFAVTCAIALQSCLSMAESALKHIGRTAPLSRKAAGPSKLYSLVADDLHVINTRPAAGEKIEDSTDLVRPIMMCDAIPDINTRALLVNSRCDSDLFDIYTLTSSECPLAICLPQCSSVYGPDGNPFKSTARGCSSC